MRISNKDIERYWSRLKAKNEYLMYVRTLKKQHQRRRRKVKYTDRQAIIAMYTKYTGKVPDLVHPETFSEKMQWMKLHYRKDMMTVVADKYEMRGYVARAGYTDLLLPLIGVYDNVEDIDFISLPNQFVIKATHGSGWNLVVKDKQEVHWAVWKKILGIWLHSSYFFQGREWPYKNMPPRIIIEEYIEDDSGGLMDYKFFCFHGKAHCLQVDKERHADRHIQRFYNLNWQVIGHARRTEARFGVCIHPPKNFNEMVALAEQLSKPFPFIRIDFYEVGSKIFLGEMTFFPKSGLPYFRPEKYDKIFGRLLNINSL